MSIWQMVGAFGWCGMAFFVGMFLMQGIFMKMQMQQAAAKTEMLKGMGDRILKLFEKRKENNGKQSESQNGGGDCSTACGSATHSASSGEKETVGQPEDRDEDRGDEHDGRSGGREEESDEGAGAQGRQSDSGEAPSEEKDS